MRLRNGGKGEALPSLFPRFAPNTHMLRPHLGTSGDIVFKYINKIISNTFIIVQ
jgi:hypothetical protein